jgi:hemerythrin-like metal-binding protein
MLKLSRRHTATNCKKNAILKYLHIVPQVLPYESFTCQHKMLVGMINSLREAMLAGKGREVQKVTIEAMVDYATLHFGTEEKYMQAFGYPEYTEHKVEHDNFTKKAIELKERVNRAGFVLTLADL